MFPKKKKKKTDTNERRDTLLDKEMMFLILKHENFVAEPNKKYQTDLIF